MANFPIIVLIVKASKRRMNDLLNTLSVLNRSYKGNESKSSKNRESEEWSEQAFVITVGERTVSRHF